MASASAVIDRLKANSRPEILSGMARYGIKTENRLGVQIPELRKLAKEIGKNHSLAIELWRTGIADAQILAGMIGDPEKLTEQQMDEMVKDIDSWDVDDQTNMNLFEKSPYAWKKIRDWIRQPEEFVRRTAFSLIACLAWHDKTASNQRFIELFPLIEDAAQDQRRSIQKAASWAIRNIGKRNLLLNQEAIAVGRRIRESDTKPGRWIASDVIRELTSPAVQKRLERSKLKN